MIKRLPADENWTPLHQLRDATRAGDKTRAHEALEEVAEINPGWREWAEQYRGATGQLAEGVR